MAKLDEICSLNMGQSPDSSSYNELGDGIPFFQGNADFGELHPKVRVWCNAPTKIAHSGDILISVRAPIGALNIADRDCCIGRGLAALTVDETLCSRGYIWYAIANKVDELKAKGTGSTFKAVSKNVLGKTEISLPPLDRQQQISAILDKLSDLIFLRKQQLAKLDKLVMARFVEMFGDPISNPLNWVTRPLGAECSIITGNTPSRKVAEYYGDYIEWIKSDNINTPQTILTIAKEGLSKKGLAVGRFVDSGSILMTCIAGSIGCIGNVAIANRKVAFNQQINGIIPNGNNVWFMYTQFQLSKPAIQSSINMSLKGIMSKGHLSKMKFIFPPLELQNEYGRFASQIDKSELTIQQSLDKLEMLKKSLMQEFFGGNNI